MDIIVWMQWLDAMIQVAVNKECNRRDEFDHRWEAVSDLDSILTEVILDNGNLNHFEEVVDCLICDKEIKKFTAVRTQDEGGDVAFMCFVCE